MSNASAAAIASEQYQLANISDTKVPAIIVCNAICLAAACVAVILRIIARRLIKISLQADDWVILLALLFAIAYSTLVLAFIQFGFGRHAVLIKDPIAFAKAALASEVLYNPAIVATKTSILLLYRRIFPGRRFYITLWCVGAFALAYSFAQSMVEIFLCTPIEATWNPGMPASCINIADVLLIFSSFNIATDIVILILPLPQLWKLKISREQRLQLTGIFLLGGFVCIVSIIRALQVRDITVLDLSWSNVDGVLWSVVELNIGIVSACLPTLRPLFNFIVRGTLNPRTLAKYSGKDSRSGTGNKFKLRHTCCSWTKGDSSKPATSKDIKSLVRIETQKYDENKWISGPLVPPSCITVTTELEQSTDQELGQGFSNLC